jgi:hypothetical protein
VPKIQTSSGVNDPLLVPVPPCRRRVKPRALNGELMRHRGELSRLLNWALHAIISSRKSRKSENQKIQKCNASHAFIEKNNPPPLLLLSSSSKRIKYILQKDCCTIWECRQRETNVKRVRVTKAPTIIIANGHRKMAINKLKQQLLIHPVK